MTLHEELMIKGDGGRIEVGFLYRTYAGFAENLTGEEWVYSEFRNVHDLEMFAIEIEGLESSKQYESRAVVRRPKIEIRVILKDFKNQ